MGRRGRDVASTYAKVWAVSEAWKETTRHWFLLETHFGKRESPESSRLCWKQADWPNSVKSQSQQFIENAERLLPLRRGGMFHLWIDDFEGSCQRYTESAGD